MAVKSKWQQIVCQHEDNPRASPGEIFSFASKDASSSEGLKSAYGNSVQSPQVDLL
jgi:hypothetical protein